MYDIIIVGAGPAGMTAAIYALRANKRVLLLEARCYGGQIVNAYKVENYPGILNISGYELATNMFNQVNNLGCDIKFEEVIGIKDRSVITKNNYYEGKAIILATGADNRKIGIDLEDKFIGHGISYCATCDGNFYKDKVVAVVGGGNTALEDTIYLSSIAKKVYLIHRRDYFRGDDKYLKEIRNFSNVEIITNSNIVELLGDDNLNGIILKKGNNNISISIDGLFIAIGQIPNNKIFRGFINLDDNGYIISSDGVHTSKNGIYVCGDVRVKDLRQLTTAVSDGAMASTIAIKEMERDYGK